MTKKRSDCAHPRMCSQDESFTEKIKTDKLSLEAPPADVLVKPPEK